MEQSRQEPSVRLRVIRPWRHPGMPRLSHTGPSVRGRDPVPDALPPLTPPDAAPSRTPPPAADRRIGPRVRSRPTTDPHAGPRLALASGKWLIPLSPLCYPVLERDRRDGAMTDFPRSLPDFER